MKRWRNTQTNVFICTTVCHQLAKGTPKVLVEAQMCFIYLVAVYQHKSSTVPQSARVAVTEKRASTPQSLAQLKADIQVNFWAFITPNSRVV